MQLIQVQAFRKEMLMTRGGSCSNGALGALQFISLGAVPSHHIGHDGGGCGGDLDTTPRIFQTTLWQIRFVNSNNDSHGVCATDTTCALHSSLAVVTTCARSDWAPSLSSDCFPHLQCAVQTVRALMDFEASWLYRQQKDLRDTSRCRCTVVALTATDGRTASKTRPTSPCVFTVPSPIHDGSGASYCCSVPLWPIRLWHGLKRKMLTLLLA